MIPLQSLSTEELTALMRMILSIKMDIVNKIESGNYVSEFRVLLAEFTAVNEQIELIRAEAHRRSRMN